MCYSKFIISLWNGIHNTIGGWNPFFKNVDENKVRIVGIDQVML